MSDEYTNTRTTMGDDAAFNALISGTLQNLVEDGVTTITGQYTLFRNPGIVSLRFPNLTSITSNAIADNPNLEVIDIGKQCSFNSGCFGSNVKLNSLILRGSTMSTCGNIMFYSTPIAVGKGGVFVPSDLVSTYKANSDWAAYNIYPISEYPRSTWDTISDTWTQILEAESDGTYSTKYAVGDTKVITINNNDYYAQIVAFDADPLSDTSGNAKITWILKELYADRHNMNSTNNNAYGWPSTSMRSWLVSDVLPLFPEPVKTAIKEVKKYSYDKTTSADVTSNDKLWIPSAREVLTSSSYGYESNGPTYTTVFNSNDAIIKYFGFSAENWWIRSVNGNNNTRFQNVNNNGISSHSLADSFNGVALGFCT